MPNMSNGLARIETKLQAAESKLQSVRRSANVKAKAVQRDATAMAAAYVYGAWSKDRRANSQALPTFFGLDPEVAATLVLYAGGMALDGEAAELAHDAALGIACGYARKKAST